MLDPYMRDFIYANAEDAFALVEEYWSNETPVFANAYNRIGQFGGDPSFQDVWTDPAKDRLQSKDSVLWWLTKMAVQTELDLAMNGLSGESKGAMPPYTSTNLWRFDEEIAEYIAWGAPMPDNMMSEADLRICYRVAHASATRVAKACAACYR